MPSWQISRPLITVRIIATQAEINAIPYLRYLFVEKRLDIINLTI